MKIFTHNLGFPQIGPRRELKKAFESYWSGQSNKAALFATANEIQQQNWKLQKSAGVNLISSNDFSSYDHVLDTCALDADVISIEASRSGMELLSAFVDFQYPNEIGPGVWDIHSPRIPSVKAMESLIRAALKVIRAERLWINPDCGLKTRSWSEVKTSLRNLIQATRTAREQLSRDVSHPKETLTH